MSGDKVSITPGSGEDIDVKTLANGKELPVSALAVYTAGAGGSAGTRTLVDATNPLPVSDSAAATALGALATQTTAAAILAKLSADPATQTTLAAVLAKLSSDPATQTTLAAVLSALQGTLTVGLPSGAATSAAQATGNTSLASILSALQGTLSVGLPSGAATAANQGTGNTSLASILAALQGTLAVDGSGHTQPVSGPWSDGSAVQAPRVFDADTGAGTQYVAGLMLRASANGGSVEAGTSTNPLRCDPTGTTTQPVSAASLPLPTGAATAAAQATAQTSLSSIDGKLTACNTGAVTVTTCALPTGAATAAKQDTAQTTLSSIDGKITACNTGAVTVSSCALPTGAATDAVLTGGTQKAIARGGAKGATSAADITSTASGSNHQGADVVMYDAAGTVVSDVALSTLAKESGGNLASAASSLTTLVARTPALGQQTTAQSTSITYATTSNYAQYGVTTTTYTIKASAGRVYHVESNNGTGGTVTLALFDKASAPSGGDLAKVEMTIANTSQNSRDLGAHGFSFVNGITAVVLSTPRTNSPAAVTAVTFSVEYE